MDDQLQQLQQQLQQHQQQAQQQITALTQQLNQQQQTLQQQQLLLQQQPPPPQPLPPPQFPSIRLPKPEPFSGSAHDVATWLWAFEHYCTLSNIAATHERITLAVTYFRADAQIWARAQELSGVPFASWPAFTQALRSRFQPIDPEQSARDALDNCRHGKRSVREYATEFTNLAMQISDMSDGDKIHRFTSQLQRTVRLQVRLHQPATLTAAIDLAHRVDATFGNGLPPPDSDAMELGALPAGRRRLTDAGREYLRANEGCFYCRKLHVPDHIPHCPDAPSRRRSSENGSRQ